MLSPKLETQKFSSVVNLFNYQMQILSIKQKAALRALWQKRCALQKCNWIARTYNYFSFGFPPLHGTLENLYSQLVQSHGLKWVCTFK